MKRTKPNILVRIYSGRSVGITTFLALATIGGFIFAVSPPTSFNLLGKIITFVTVPVMAILAAYLRGRQKLLPDIIIDELSAENSYSVSFCTQPGLRVADEMTRHLFGRDFIPFDQIEQWRLRNEKGFVQICNADGVLCACFVIIGLEHSFFDQFIAGRVTEHDIDSNVILPFNGMKKEERIYISGVVVRDPHLYMGRKRVAKMLWVMLQYIKKVFGLRKSRTFYAVGLTSESERLLKTMGFSICSDKVNRKDKSNLYSIALDKKKWEELVAKIGDYSKTVSFHIDA